VAESRRSTAVGGGVVVAQDAVLAAGDDLAVEGEDGADGDFAIALAARASAMQARRKSRSSGIFFDQCKPPRICGIRCSGAKDPVNRAVLFVG